MKNFILSIMVVACSGICIFFMLSSGKKHNDNLYSLNAAAENSTVASGKKSSNTNYQPSAGVNKQDTSGISVGESSSTVDTPATFFIYSSDLKKELSISEKENLLILASKLAPVEYSIISEEVQQGGADGCVNAIKLLKLRFGEKDFQRVKEVTGGSINYEAVEKRNKQ